jgi:hypothetical protein
MCAEHKMRVLSGLQPRQVDEIMQTYNLRMIQTDKGLLFEGELEDLRHAANHVVDVTIPPGPTISEIKSAVEGSDVKIKQTDDGPQFHGTMNDINKAINNIVDQMNERI